VSRESPGELAFDGVLIALGTHERMLESLRSRTSSVIAACALSASFLGSAAIGGPGQSCVHYLLIGVGFAAFVGTLGFALAVVWPRSDRWPLEVSPRAIIAIAGDSATLDEAALRRMATETEDQLDAMKEAMAPLWAQFRVAVILLGVQVCAWLAALVWK
jgi:hypothetical protein